VDNTEAEAIVLGVHYPWEGSDRDYKYEEVNVALLQPGNFLGVFSELALKLV
jgi:hypothetical protein